MKKLLPCLLGVSLPVLWLGVAICSPLALAAETVTTPDLTAVELASAVKDFGTYCVVCHGDKARGRGPVAKELKTPPSDLTRISARAGGVFPAAAVYKKIEGLDMPLAHGTSEMPIWGALFVHQAVGDGVLIEDAKTAARVATQRMKRLVKYLETIQE
jgi:mono/diheme cytochrome c family protein